MSTDRPATTDTADLIAREVATSIIAAQLTRSWADRVDAARRARHIVAALDRAGYTVAMMPIRPDGSTAAPRASEAVRGDGSPTPAEEAVRGGEGGSAAESEPRPVDLAFAALGKWFHNSTPGAEYTYTGHTDDPADCGICWEAAEKATEAAAPLIRAAERELVAAQIEAVFVLAAAAIARGES